ncbi:hypothetical protein BGW38_005460, partial [Lunasporangiospora selenospora]
ETSHHARASLGTKARAKGPLHTGSRRSLHQGTHRRQHMSVKNQPNVTACATLSRPVSFRTIKRHATAAALATEPPSTLDSSNRSSWHINRNFQESSALPSTHDHPHPQTLLAESSASKEDTRSTTRSLSSWEFPDIKATTEPVQSWPSTSKALSQFYGSLHRIGNRLGASFHPTNSSGPLSLSALHLALNNYNYLSQLQQTFDVVLVPRRDVRTLFLIQGRQPKSARNLELLLRLASDLIWLNEKDRQKRRRPISTMADTSVYSNEDTMVRIRSSLTHTATPNNAHTGIGGFHGLRTSEYTILMNWIMSAVRQANFKNVYPLSKQQQHSPHDHQRSSPTSAPAAPVNLTSPVDRAWALWQDFLLTGMKPDVVLYTVLVDTFLMTKEYDRAEEIWNHMQQNGLSDPDSSSKLQGRHDSDTPSQSNSTTTSNTPLKMSTMVMGHLQNRLARGQWDSIGPNLQTLSVLMKAHTDNQDLGGVTETFKQLAFHNASMSKEPTSSHSPEANGHSSTEILYRQRLSGRLERGSNTVLMNQILKVLIELGETEAARGIYQQIILALEPGSSRSTKQRKDMTLDGSDKQTVASEAAPALQPMLTGFELPASATAFSTQTSESIENDASAEHETRPGRIRRYLARSPLHHQVSERRSRWRAETLSYRKLSERDIVRGNEPEGSDGRGVVGAQATRFSTKSTMVTTLIKPSEATFALMMELAYREQDKELEDQIQRDKML